MVEGRWWREWRVQEETHSQIYPTSVPHITEPVHHITERCFSKSTRRSESIWVWSICRTRSSAAAADVSHTLLSVELGESTALSFGVLLLTQLPLAAQAQGFDAFASLQLWHEQFGQNFGFLAFGLPLRLAFVNLAEASLTRVSLSTIACGSGANRFFPQSSKFGKPWSTGGFTSRTGPAAPHHTAKRAPATASFGSCAAQQRAARGSTSHTWVECGRLQSSVGHLGDRATSSHSPPDTTPKPPANYYEGRPSSYGLNEETPEKSIDSTPPQKWSRH